MESDYVKTITRSNLLIEKDLDYITSSNPKVLQVSDEASSTSTPALSVNFPTSRYRYQHCLIMIVSVFMAGLTFNVSLWIPVFVSAVFPVMWLVQMKIASQQRAKLGDVNTLEEFLHANEKFQMLLQKCIRFIQEMEVAAMGYTLISGKTPMHLWERSKRKVIRECMQLRYQLLKHLVDSILQYREATLDLLHSGTPSQDAKFSLSICQIPLEELGPCFVEGTTHSELADATDNFCLDILRDTSQFLIQQRSEFLKLLVLSLPNKSVKETSKFPSLPLETMKKLKKSCDDASKKLGDLYELHLTAQFDVINYDSKLKKTPVPATKSTSRVAIHSIQVHLRAALLVAIECEKYLEEHSSVDDLKDGLLLQLRIHLDASNECLAETNRCFDHNSEETGNEKSAKYAATPVECSNGASLQVDSSLLNTQDEFTEDQIFEGTPDDNKEAENEVDDIFEFINNRKKRIEETECVMNELKSVLHVKTSAQEREVRKSKLFPNYVPKVIHTSGDVDSKSDESDLSLQILETAKFEYRPSETSLESGGVNQEHNSEHILESSGDLPDFTHKILTMPRRPLPPGRTKYRPSRSEHSIDTIGITKREENDYFNADHGPVALGFGFPSVLASQAAKVALDAKIRNAKMGLSGTAEPCIGLIGNETTFGEDDSDS